MTNEGAAPGYSCDERRKSTTTDDAESPRGHRGARKKRETGGGKRATSNLSLLVTVSEFRSYVSRDRETMILL